MSCRLLLPVQPLCSRPRQRLRVRRTAEDIRCCSGISSSTASSSKNRRGGDDDYHATVRALNTKGRHTPRKSLGQHYMLNSSINERLSELAEIKEGDVVLEIGPGTGSLTSVLIKSGATVVAVEKDPYMAELVKERFQGTNYLEVLQEDFIKCHFQPHITSLLEKKKSREGALEFAKVVSNLPFNISTDVIKLLLPMGDMFSDVVLLLQDEAALRLVNCSSEYRPINIFVNFYSDPVYEFKVERSNFFPRPNVDAAIVSFKLKKPADYPPVTSTKSFFAMVNTAFNGKRKMLRKTLLHLSSSSEIEDVLRNIGLPVTSRPEELTLGDFVRIHNLIAKTLKPYHTGQIERKEVISLLHHELFAEGGEIRRKPNHLAGLVVCEDNGTAIQESQEVSQIGRHVMLTISYQLTISPPWLSGWMNLLVHR